MHAYAKCDVVMDVHLAASQIFLLFALLVVAGKQLVLPEGVEHSILCRAPAGMNYGIFWAVDGIQIQGEYMGFTVTEEEILADGMKGIRIIFTAASNATLRCFVTDFSGVDSFEPFVIDITIQGLLY